MKQISNISQNYLVGPSALLCCYTDDYQLIGKMLDPHRLINISCLMLWDIEFDDDCMITFVSGFAHQPCHIKTLNFSNNRIGIKGAESLSELLRVRNNQVRILSLFRNNIGDQGTYWISTTLKFLEELNLDHNEISDKGLQYINQEIKGSHLCSLSLCYNFITSTSAAVLINISQTLKHISLRSNMIDQYLIIRLKQKVKSLSHRWKLQYLSLSYNYISNTNEHWKELQSLIKNNSLCTLSLDLLMRTKLDKPPTMATNLESTIQRLCQDFISNAATINFNQIQTHSSFEQLVILTTHNEATLSKTTIIQLHQLMLSGAQYKNYFILPTFIPSSSESLLSSQHFCIQFWEQLVNQMHSAHPYIRTLKKVIFMLREIHRNAGFPKTRQTCFFNNLHINPINSMKVIEL